MTKPMYVLTITSEEWEYLDKHVRRARKAPEGLRFALDSASKVQEHTEAPRRTTAYESHFNFNRMYEGMRGTSDPDSAL